MADFHEKLQATIDDTITRLLGESVHEILQEHLIKEYDLTPDKIPYRLDTFVEILDNVFGVAGSRTIGWAIAWDFSAKIGLRFVESANFRLQDYLAQVKKTIAIHD
jgi:hypothetical protein